MKQLLPLIYLFIFSIYANGQWTATQFGPGPMVDSYDLEVANGRTDGTNRIYVTTTNGGVYEWTYTAGSYTSTTVATGLNGLVTIAVGDADNDGTNNLYFTEFVNGGRVFEASWGGTAWNVQMIDSGHQSLTVFVGKGRNDSKNYLYMGTAGTGLWEYDWNGSAWIKTLMHFVGCEGVGVVGDSRNDGIRRVISTSNDVKEYWWGGASYLYVTPSPATEWPDAIVIGQSRNDGQNRILANATAAGRGRVEYHWNGTVWVETMIDPTPWRGDLYAGKLEADGLTRMYTTFSMYFSQPVAGPLMEYEWNGASYDTTTILNGVSGATAMVVSGVGRNDDTTRLYATNFVAGTVYELTHVSPFVDTSAILPPSAIENIEPELPSFTLTIQPNPANEFVLTTISNPEGEQLLIDVIDINGRQIGESFLSTEKQISRRIDLSNVSKGLYFVRVTGHEWDRQKRLIVD